MSVSQIENSVTNETVSHAIREATSSIAPSWPLDRLIAVNPYWHYVRRPFNETASTLAGLAGSPLTMPMDYYRDAWRNGDIVEADLDRAIAENNIRTTTDQLIEALDRQPSATQPLPLLSDQIDSRRDLQTHPSWFDTITHEVSQLCAAHFDSHQAGWHPGRADSLYACWRRRISKDRSIHLLMGQPRVRARAQALAPDAFDQIAASLKALAVPEQEWAGYLQALLLRIGGWASWCAYIRWQKQLDGQTDETLVDLLAIRLSWETLLDDGERGAGSAWADWMSDWLDHDANRQNIALETQLAWQRAHEIRYQRKLISRLMSASATALDPAPRVQAAFCIDVRSEVFRRHFENQSSDVQTLGFAGFFGLPIDYSPLGTQASRPQLPGLLAAELNITDSSGDSDLDARISSRRSTWLQEKSIWQTFETAPLSTFSLVETLGIGYLVKLFKRSLPSSNPRVSEDNSGLTADQARILRPTLGSTEAGGIEGQAGIAATVLGAMGFRNTYGRVVLLIGHGSQTVNNPHRAGLDCGACCGQSGDVNARALAGLLNDPAVRAQLCKQGIEIPDSTVFVAGLHNTTTDDVELLDRDQIPLSHRQDIELIDQQLQKAGACARAERAPALGFGDLAGRPTALHKEVRRRADDWSQTRPEWGLANNAAFIIAPRSRTRGVNLEGRCFLHDYDERQDVDGSLLEQIMTAPMIVTHWINMQYFASTVDNRRYGSGNKTLHNVVGGNIGVFEGNGGDLRIGLPWQSIHDGDRYCHEPLRLTVFIEASQASIEAVIEKHEVVRQLVDNQWLYLMRLDTERVEVYRNGQWQVSPG